MNDHRDRTDRLRSGRRTAFLMGLVVAFLLPALGTGYWAEDVHHSVVVPGRQVLGGGTLLDEVVGHLKHTIEMGRFFPGTAVLISVVHFLIRDVFAYKVFLVAMTALDVLIFHRFLRGLSGRSGFASVASCLTLGLFQFRVFVDPMLGYYAQMQVVVAALFASLTALLLYLEGRGIGWLAAGAAIFAICPLTYEASYPLVLLPLCLIWWARSGRRSGIAAWLPFLGIVGLLPGRDDRGPTAPSRRHVLASDGLRPRGHAACPGPADRRGPALELFPGGPSGPLPPSVQRARLPRLGVARRRGRGSPSPRWRSASSPSAARIGPGLRRSCHGTGSWPLGVMLAVLPGTMITISPYHRSYLAFGVGWVPVFIQSFGVGMLLATGLWLAVGLERPGAEAPPSEGDDRVDAHRRARRMDVPGELRGRAQLQCSSRNVSVS